MANPGLGYRLAADLLTEISFHLCQPTVITQIVSLAEAGFGAGGFGEGGFGGGTGSSIEVDSTYAMYPGALVIVGWQNEDAEVVEVLTVPDATHFTATLVNNHSVGETILGPTFPIQQDTDPIFTQAEMLGYLSRAQNEFLTAVPAFYELFSQNVTIGEIYQSLPNTAITVERVAASPVEIPITSLVRSNNVVTLTAETATNLTPYSTLAVVGSDDTSFAGVFSVTSAPSANVITYPQIGSNASTTGGTIQSMRRLYELTQEELSQRDRTWQVNYTNPLQSWFEDRAGLYKWGVGGRPSANFPVELLCAVRDTDTLGLLDGFLVPDLCLHAVKYLALNYVWRKDGVQQQPEMAEFALKRYAQIVMATQRYIEHMKMGAGK